MTFFRLSSFSSLLVQFCLLIIVQVIIISIQAMMNFIKNHERSSCGIPKRVIYSSSN